MEQLCQLSGTAGRFDSSRCRGLNERKRKSPTLKKTEGRAPANSRSKSSHPNPQRKGGAPGRFYDFNAWSLQKRVEKLDYMHMNPLKRKLADHPMDWPWSSFSFYAALKSGLILAPIL